MTTRLQIRRGDPRDAIALAAFAARTFVETFGADNDPRKLQAHVASTYGIGQQTAELSDPAVVTLLATLDDLVAYAQVRRSRPPQCVEPAGSVELQRFYVDRSAHGTGVAQQLMGAVRASARALGADRLWLGVWEHNPRAIAFYAKAGFRDVGAHTFDVGGDLQVDRVMVASLDLAFAG